MFSLHYLKSSWVSEKSHWRMGNTSQSLADRVYSLQKSAAVVSTDISSQ